MDVLSQPSAIATRKLNSTVIRLEEESLSNKEGWDMILELPVKPQALKEKETTSSTMSTITESLSDVTSDADPSQPTHSSTKTLAAAEKEDNRPGYDGCEDTKLKVYPRSCLKIKSQDASVGQSFDATRQSPPAASGKQPVRFATITILSHEVCLGDSPSVTNGPPIQIDWTAFDTASFDLNDFEETKPPARLRPEMQLPAYVREDILMRAGFSRPELKAASREAQQLQKRILKSSRDADRWWSLLQRKVVKRKGGKHTDGALICKANAT